MRFCQLCGSMMKVENRMYRCSCGNFEYLTRSLVLQDKKDAVRQVAVLHDDVNPLAVHVHTCSACGFGRAQLVSRGISVSDEDEMTEFVCGRCGHHDPEDGLKA